MGHEHDRREWTVIDAGAGLGYFTSAVVEAAFGPASDFAAAFGRRALGMAAVEYGAIEVARAPCERLNTVGGLGCDANVVFQPDDLARQLYHHGPGQVNTAAADANWTVVLIEGGSRNADFLKNFFSSSSDPLAAAAPDAIARHRHAATVAAEAAAVPGGGDDAAAVGNVPEERPPDAELGSVAEPMAVDHDGSAAVKALEAAAKAKVAALQRTVSPQSPAGRGRALVAAADSRLRFLHRHAAIVPEESGSLHFPEHCAFGDVDGCRAVSSSQADRKASSTVDRDGKLHINQPTPAMPLDALLPRRFRQPSTAQAAVVDVLSLDLGGLGLAVATHSKLIGRGQVRLLVVDVGPTTTAEYAKTTAVATAPREGKRSRRDRVVAEASVRYGEMVRDGLEFLHRHGYACFAAVESAGIERQCSAGGSGGTQQEEQRHHHQVDAGQEDEAEAPQHGGEHSHGRSFVPLNPVASCWNAERYGNELRGARVLCAARTEKALLAELRHNSEPSPAPVMASHDRGGPTCCRHPAEGFRHLAASVLAGGRHKHSATASASALATSTAYPSPAWLWATEAFRAPDKCPATHAAYPNH
jgi:hypothetical protein